MDFSCIHDSLDSVFHLSISNILCRIFIQQLLTCDLLHLFSFDTASVLLKSYLGVFELMVFV
jgi:hypothetical protein